MPRPRSRRGRRAGSRWTRRRPGTSSMTTSERAWASSRRSRASISRPSPHTSSRRSADSRSRFATPTKTERVTADDAVRTARATMAWFLRSRPTGRTVTGASTSTSGTVAMAASVATRTCAWPERAASFEASSRASPRSPAIVEGWRSPMACRTRPRSFDSLTTIRAVRSAAMTLTVPPVGRSPSASMAAAFAASRRVGATSVAAMLADVSTMSTMSPARPAGRSRNGRAASSAMMTTRRSCSSSSRLRRSFCHGAFASTSVSRRLHSSVDGTTARSRRSLSMYIASTAGMNSSPSSASGLVNGIGQPRTRRRRSSANIRSDRFASDGRSTYVARRLAATSAKPAFQAARRDL